MAKDKDRIGNDKTGEINPRDQLDYKDSAGVANNDNYRFGLP